MTFLEKIFFNFTIYTTFLCVVGNTNAQLSRAESCRALCHGMSQSPVELAYRKNSRSTQSEAFLPQSYRQPMPWNTGYLPISDNSDSNSEMSTVTDFRPIIGRQLMPTLLRTRIILSIDGGGSRGIIPLFYIKSLLEELNVEQLPVDIIAGTSVGSLIGTSLLLGKTKILFNDFQNTVKKIFCKNRGSLWGLLGPKYSPEGRQQVIQEYLGENGEQQIKDSNIDFIVPFASSKTFKDFLYDNHDTHCDFPLFDALMASSAAPTFFPPHIFTGRDRYSIYEGVDGGVFANHPGMQAYSYAHKKYPYDRLVMISLGTGIYNQYSTRKNLGLLGWAKLFPELSMAVNTNSDNRELTRIAEHFSNHFLYIRINPTIEKNTFLTDSVDSEYLDKLTKIAEFSIDEHGPLRLQYIHTLKILQAEINRRNTQQN